MKYTSANSSSKRTLDTRHSTKLDYFEERQTLMQTQQKQLKDVTENLNKVNEQRKSFIDTRVPDAILDQYLALCDEKKLLEDSINKMEQSSDEIDYYVNTSSLLFQYYDLVEKGMQDANNNANVANIMKEKSILKYFLTESASNIEKTKEDNVSHQVDDKATLLDKYLAFTDPNYIRANDECKDECANCGSSNRNIMVNDGYVFCNDCHCIEYVIVDHERPSYRDPPKEITYFAYKRINHFQELILLLTASLKRELLASLLVI